MAPGSEEEAELLEAIKPWLEKMVAEGHTWEEIEAKLDELCRALFEPLFRADPTFNHPRKGRRPVSHQAMLRRG